MDVLYDISTIIGEYRLFVNNSKLKETLYSNMDNKQWVIPGEKMKIGSDHIISLSDLLLKILKQAKHYAKGDKYIFYSNRDANAPMSNVTLGKALRTTIGYSNDRIVPHGFRAMFSTIAHKKSNFSSEVIKVQLATR